MSRAIRSKRILKTVSTVVFALVCGSAAGQGVMKTAPAPNRNITLAGAQKQGAPSGPALPGTIEGFVYWDTGAVAHNPAGACDGFSISVIAGGHVLQAASGQFGAKYIGQVKSYLVGGKIVAYDVCTYAYGNVVENVPLRVELNITQPASFSTAVAPATPIVGPVTIINAQCNMLPNIATATLADLTAHWGSCQNMGYDVNFQLTPASRAARATMLSPRNGTLLQTAPRSSTPSRPMLLQQGSQPGAAAPSGGMLVSAVKPATSATARTKANSSAHAALKPIKLAAPKALRRIVDPQLGQKNAALFTQLAQQRQAADQQSTQMKLAAQASTTVAASTGASGTRAAVPAVQMQTNASTQIGAESTQDSTGSSPFHVINRNYWEPPAIACHQNPAPRILSAPPVFTPEAKYNSFAISGCGFGASSNGNTVYIYGVNGFRENLSIDFWSDLGITAHFDPTVAIGVLDQNNVTLVVAPSGRQEMQKSGFRFYAARGMPAADGSDQEVALAYDSLAQSRVNLSSVVGVGHDTNGGDAIALGNILGPGFDQASGNFKSDSGYSFQGTPVSGWVLRYVYGHTDEENSLLYPENWFTWNSHPISCYINDVSYQDGAGKHPCAAYFGRLLSFGADTWDFSGLAPGFVISSYNLYYADPDPRSLCGAWDETSHDDGIGGTWDFSLNGSQISVTWPVYWCQDTEAMPFARVNQQELSAYGVAVWVMGPRCVDPWSGQADQVCVAKVRQIPGN